MFQSNKAEDKMSSILSPQVEVHGDVKASGDVLVYGKIFGSIKAKGIVKTARGSVVKGNVIAAGASIGGVVEGDLTVNKKAILGSKSVLKGNLKAEILVVEEGAQFDGMCNMVNNTSTSPNKSS
jgi:cytoskeletal protein CcmA (bactofilin family)